MVAKAVLILCAQALFIQAAFSQCLSLPTSCGCGSGLGYGSLGLSGLGGLGGIGSYNGLGLTNLAGSLSASNGGGLGVTSVSPLSPNGMSVLSDNVIEGSCCVGGQIPFISSVGLGGNLPTAGAASVNYACGNGQLGLTGEGINGLGYSGFSGVNGLGLGNYGYGLSGLGGYGGCGCGCL